MSENKKSNDNKIERFHSQPCKTCGLQIIRLKTELVWQCEECLPKQVLEPLPDLSATEWISLLQNISLETAENLLLSDKQSQDDEQKKERQSDLIYTED